MKKEEILHITVTALCVILIIGGAYLTINLPVTPVPIVLQDMMIIVSVLLLGPRWGLACVGTYLLLGLLNFPVFSGGRGGFAVILGPTGGYLAGYLLVAVVSGTISLRRKLSTDIIAWVCAVVLIFSAGVPWLKLATGYSWTKAIFVGFLVFIPGSIVKGLAGVALVQALRPLLPFDKK